MHNRSPAGFALATLFFFCFVVPVNGQETWAVPVDDELGHVGGPSNPCDSIGPPRCDARYQHWRITAAAIFLERSTPESFVLAEDTSDPTRSLNADAFNFGFHTGWELSVARPLRTGYEIEFRYFGVDQFDALADVATNPAGALLRINTNPPTFDPNVQSIAARYNSQLQSCELNFRRPCGDWTSLLGGLRYLELDEQLHADLSTPAPTFTYETETRNRLYGGQLGAEAVLWCANRLSVDASIKAGLFGNEGHHTTAHNTTTVTDLAIDAADHAAFVGEFGLVGDYYFTDCFSIRLGYQLLWIESVALASEQIAVTDFGSGDGINLNGGVFYHGAYIGFELLF
jgi:hypothetical protein